MKRLEHRDVFFQRFPAAALYLDDIEIIISEFAKYGHSVEFKDDDYQFDTLEEVIKVRGTSPTRLVIESTKPSGPALRFSRWSKTGLTLRQGADPSDRALLGAIAEVLMRRRLWITRLLAPSVIGAFAFASFFAIFFAPEIYNGYLALSAFLLFFAYVFASNLQTGLCSSVNFAHRHATTTFWTRHGEKILVAIISAIVGAAGKFVLDKVLH